MASPTEIVLFHAHDPAPALYFGDVPHEALFDVCVRSIRAKSPGSRITLLTDPFTNIHARYPDVIAFRDASIRPEFIMYERARLYGEHVARRAHEGSMTPLVFLDIDIIVNRDLGGVFAAAFDVGLTCRLRQGVILNARGLPANTQESPINGGVLFARPTVAAAEFFREQMHVYDRLHAEGNIPHAMAKDIRKWGGDQFALMAMVGRELFAKRSETLKYGEATVRFFDCGTYNFTPDADTQMSHAMLADKYILHMKGPRKKLMPQLAQWMGIP